MVSKATSTSVAVNQPRFAMFDHSSVKKVLKVL